jgi:hypothetical protein
MATVKKTDMEDKDKPLKIEFAEGCFDGFEGTPDELAELIAHIHELAESGKLFEGARQVPPEELEELGFDPDDYTNLKKETRQ